ncbi:MAG: NUDIX hydrolase, partial [Methanosarcina sp.]|nr:NUDIX hydrolase [Methanosarcina sp.]
MGEQISHREIIEHNGGVALAVITDEGKMVLVRQFRKAAEKVILEVPAGKIDPGEDPFHSAVRELKEETGYTAEKIEHLTSFYSSVGYSEEIIHLYMATGLTPGETEFDSNEALEILEY